MAMEFLSIVTLLNYDPDLFDNLELPDVDITVNGVTTNYTIDPDILIPEICFECSDLQLIYPDADYMKGLIGLWSEANYDVWRRLLYTCVVPYNPLWNVDADIVDSTSGSNTGSTSGTSSGSTTGTTSGTATNESVQSVKGYNSSTWADHEKTEDSGTTSGSTSGTSSGTTSGTESKTWSETHSTRRTGNIGVTSSQELIERERKVSEFSIYKYIVDSFKKRFCLMVY